jgi:hypothetical protein
MSIVDLIVLAVTVVFLLDLVRVYRGAIGTVWQRCIAALKGAASSLWTGFTVGALFLINTLAQLAELVNAPQVAAALQAYGKPSVVAGIMIASAVILEYARRAKAG